MFKYFLYLSFLFAPFISSSAQTDSVSISALSSVLDSHVQPDSLQDANFFWASERYLNSTDLGFLGSPIYSYNALPQVSFFSSPQFLTPATPHELYFTSQPVSSFQYQLATNREQNLKVSHYQNLSPYLGFNLDYLKNRNEGSFLQQFLSDDDLSIRPFFFSRNRSFSASANFRYLRSKREENGGLDSIGSFQENEFTSYLLYPVNLTSASSQTNTVYVAADMKWFPLKKDSSQTNGLYLFSHQEFQQNKWFYTDIPNLNFFPGVLRDSLQSFDSIGRKRYFSDISVGLQFLKNAYFQAGFFIDPTQLENSDSLFSNYTNNPVLGSSGITAKAKWADSLHQIDFTANYYLSGYNQNDFSASLNYSGRFKKYKLSVAIDAIGKTVDPFWIYHSSNYHFWKDQSRRNFHFRSELTIAHASGWALSGGYHYLENEYFLTQQFNQSTLLNGQEMLKMSASYKRQWKHLYFSSEAIYRNVITDSTSLRVPPLTGAVDLAYVSSGKRLRVRTGVRGVLIPELSGLNYDPSLSLYSINTMTEAPEISLYPLMDVYARFTIKQVVLGLIMTHWNQNLTGSGDITFNNYPLQGRTFRLFLRWDFLN